MVPLSQARVQLSECLAALTTAGEALGATGVLRGLRAEEARLAGARFVVAIVGERGTGKSTLANALLGQPYLPARPVPTTALVHSVEFADTASALVREPNGDERPIEMAALGEWAEGQPGAEDRARRVIVRAPAELLRGGVMLLDTPGTNDLSALGAELTYGILPEADAIVLVLDATQPLRRTEREFLEHRLPFAARERTIAVLNRTDLLGVTELEEAREYARRQLEKVMPGTPLFVASAKLALERKDEGFDALREQLQATVGRDRQRIVLLHAAGEALHLCHGLRDHVRMRRDAGALAEGELEAKLARLQHATGGSRDVVHQACARVDTRAAEVAMEAEGRLADFASKFKAALPREIEGADETELRKYLPFFLEDTLRLFAESEAERVEQALSALAYEVLSELATKTAADKSALELGPATPVNVEVDTMKYDVGVVAAGALGTMFLFSSPLIGILLLAAAPVLNHVLKGRVAGRVREVAKEQALLAVDSATQRLGARLREEIMASAARLREAVMSHGESAAQDAEVALTQALSDRRAGVVSHEASAALADADGRVEASARTLEQLAEALAAQG